MTNPLTAASLARDALEDADGIVSDAVEMMYGRVVANPTFMREHLPAMVRSWCQSHIGTATGLRRKAAWEGLPPTHNAERLNAAIKRSLMSFPLPRGKRLADASVDDLADAIDHYRGKADDAAWKARWLAKIKARIGNAHRVEDVLSEVELEELQREAEN